METLFSDRAKNIVASEIREILKLTSKEGIISFAGGLPAPELFPYQQLKSISREVLDSMGPAALQYNTTEGYEPLREKIAERMTNQGMKTSADDVLITNGSQQGLDFAGKIFLNPNDIVLCESPSYLGAINAFRAYGCDFVEVDTDEDGMVMASLEEKLKTVENVKFIYVIPNFQNPTGRTWTLERRKELMALANKYNKVIIEDNPYGELRYEGEAVASLRSMDTEGRVVYLGTFSKTFCPGLRIGWVTASPTLLNKFILVKQGADLQTNSMSQRELDLFLEQNDFDAHIQTLIALYKKRRDIMVDAIESYFPKHVSYGKPHGGLFLWVTVPEGIDTKVLLDKAVDLGVAYVPGVSFFPSGMTKNTMRLNFSNMNEEKIVEGIKILGKLLE
ncbi:MAG: PLP-dependent aminotransferase family protein [Clostridia bacterium]|nr:PLP-dependent aminotransferase family protein [Clostridia bacterium]